MNRLSNNRQNLKNLTQKKRRIFDCDRSKSPLKDNNGLDFTVYGTSIVMKPKPKSKQPSCSLNVSQAKIPSPDIHLQKNNGIETCKNPSNKDPLAPLNDLNDTNNIIGRSIKQKSIFFHEYNPNDMIDIASVYLDYPASGQEDRTINRMMDIKMERYANTHTDSSTNGKYMKQFMAIWTRTKTT